MRVLLDTSTAIIHCTLCNVRSVRSRFQMAENESVRLPVASENQTTRFNRAKLPATP